MENLVRLPVFGSFCRQVSKILLMQPLQRTVRDFSGKKRNCFQTLDSQLLMRATFSNFEKLFSSLQSYELIELCCLSFRPSFRVCVSVSLKNSHMQPLQ